MIFAQGTDACPPAAVLFFFTAGIGFLVCALVAWGVWWKYGKSGRLKNPELRQALGCAAWVLGPIFAILGVWCLWTLLSMLQPPRPPDPRVIRPTPPPAVPAPSDSSSTAEPTEKGNAVRQK